MYTKFFYVSGIFPMYEPMTEYVLSAETWLLNDSTAMVKLVASKTSVWK